MESMALMNSFAYAAFLLNCFVASAQEMEKPSPLSQTDVRRINALVEKFMTDHRIPGAAIGVCRNGKLVFAQGYGYSNIATKSKALASSPFQLASVTKQFTAAAIMLLVQDGKLNLDDPIHKHLRQLPLAWRDVSVEHLLTHTSGIPDYMAASGFAQFNPARGNVLGLIANSPLEFIPGTRHKYSNSGYLILGMLILQSSGKTYDRFLGDRVFSKLGMKSTGLHSSRDPRNSVGYYESVSGFQVAPPLHGEVWNNADGGLVSTIEDMAKWENALYAKTILTDSSLRRMWTRLRLADGTVKDYGFGWVVNQHPNRRIIGHGGGRVGATANFTRWPEDGIAVIVLCNNRLVGNDSYQLASGVARIVVPDIP